MRRWWIGYLVAGAVLLGYVLTLPVGLLRSAVYELFPLASAAAVVAGVVLHRPPRRLPWLLIAGGQLCSAVGDLLYAWLDVVLHVSPFPSVADLGYLAAYPLQAAGIVLLTRGRRLNAAGRLDVGIVTVALALPLWVFLVEPVVLSPAEPLLDRLADLSYPLADLVVLALLVRCGAVTRGLNPAARLLALGALVLPVADLAYAAFGNDGVLAHLNTACWLTTYLCWGAAGLHPSMASVDTPDRTADPAGWRRLGLVAASMLAVPGVLVLEALEVTGEHQLDVALAALLIVVLGITRTQLALGAAQRHARRSERLRAEVDHHLAHDPLTLLPNRATALGLLRRSQERAGRTGIGVLVVDVDHLARVNDRFGDHVGDDVLRAVARELGRVVPAGSHLGRLGGDEFVVVVEDVRDETVLARAAERLTRLDLHLDARDLTLSCCVGIAVQTGGRTVGPTELLHEALSAAARAKSLGEGRTWFSDDALRAELTEQADLEAALSDALARGEFELHYQPVVDLATRDVTGFEALIRWNRPRCGTVRPDLFIPAAERSDLICDIGRWVLHEAGRQLVAWRAEGTVGEHVRVAVNLSGRHLARPTLVADVVAALTATGVPPQALVVEATETTVLDGDEVLANLRALRALGICVSLDDYGTGYTSIEHFRTLPLDTLKIDRSFLSSTQAQDEALLGLMVHAAHTFGLKVVAEGVERPEQVELLRSLGCDLGQGFLFSRPVPAAAVAELADLLRAAA
ncbi:putative bifunctional diguanylate cyclase/phosphodiesterase [Kineococcus rhizosphaerae]|uniref:Diguanylate cyclase (GGDEF)-like protein n=1 Tax=Kineococcus rhizosphaerae TaxID=559628 RepID=A0A2T0R2E5_9ACTN|nr:bifunctional diguanylate cyclase/phosphodiesterase [Kineococcus rhizosphaerae]PRY13966.1 diguanylate cyclase (GGDEF)-like protein [Kineococcus rhizosphaerae]